MRPRRTTQGFTLVELLVVIAIIGILAGFIAAGYPRVLRMAKMSAMKNNMNQIRTILTAYYVDHNTFPPAYGYLSPHILEDSRLARPDGRPFGINSRLQSTEFTENTVFFLLPWMAQLREHGNDDLYDNWTRGNTYDTDGDNIISRLEFAARGQFGGQGQPYDFNFCQLYLGDNGSSNPSGVQCIDPYSGATIQDQTQSDVDEQLATGDTRPFIYVPVNQRQARLFASIINPEGLVSDPRPFDLTQDQINDIIDRLSFPPPSYDAYVLISVGPNFVTGTNGLVVEFGSNANNLAALTDFTTNPDYPIIYQYHLLGLATYFLATRDAQDDGELDFDFTSRTSGGQAKDPINDMPGIAPKGDGPVIYVGGA